MKMFGRVTAAAAAGSASAPGLRCCPEDGPDGRSISRAAATAAAIDTTALRLLNVAIGLLLTRGCSLQAQLDALDRAAHLDTVEHEELRPPVAVPVEGGD